jgi:hypothetical protein
MLTPLTLSTPHWKDTRRSEGLADLLVLLPLSESRGGGTGFDDLL